MKTQLKLVAIALMLVAVVPSFLSFKTNRIDIKDLKGAWEYGPTNNRATMIVTDQVFAVAEYDRVGKKFLNSYGGTWWVDGDKLKQKVEWNAKDAAQVGTELTTDIKLTAGKLSTADQTWDRVDKSDKSDLAGAWIITGNFDNDKVSKRPSPFFPRRTMKVLSGSRFHWIAYNVQTKEFMNAGGGTYTIENGKYTEHIDFFTKTPESVGGSVAFQYSFVDGDWRHKGQKSTGGPLDECWSKRETLEQ